MGPEIIKGKHLPLAAILAIGSYIITRYLAQSIGEDLEQLHATLTYAGVFFLIAVPAAVLQYAENRLAAC